jgi:hypothetical protein
LCEKSIKIKKKITTPINREISINLKNCSVMNLGFAFREAAWHFRE